MYNFSLAEEREHYASLLDCLRQSLTFDASGIPSRRPRSPSLNHNVKQRRLDDFHVGISNGSTTSQPVPRSSVGAGYRCGGPPKSNAKTAIFSVFFQAAVESTEPSKTRLLRPNIWGVVVPGALQSVKMIAPSRSEWAGFQSGFPSNSLKLPWRRPLFGASQAQPPAV